MPDDSPAHLEAFPTETGQVVRLIGRGTMRESRVFHSFASDCLSSSDSCASGDVTLDLSQCQRLDSTFLGCLVDLHKRFNREGTRRFAISAPIEVTRALLGGCRLDRLLPQLDQAPEARGLGTLLMAPETVEPRALGEHVMECHRRLAEQHCPGQKAFARVADDLEKELNRLS